MWVGNLIFCAIFYCVLVDCTPPFTPHSPYNHQWHAVIQSKKLFQSQNWNMSLGCMYPLYHAVSELLSIRSYLQGLESCNYCCRLCTLGAQLSTATAKFSLRMFCANPFTTLTTTAWIEEGFFLQFQSSAPSYLPAQCPVDVHNSLCISVGVHNLTSIFLLCASSVYVYTI